MCSKLVTWQRQLAALALILVGLVSIVVCTRATLLAVHEEAQVVRVAKEIMTATQALQHAQATEDRVVKLASSVTAVDEVTRKIATLKVSVPPCGVQEMTCPIVFHDGSHFT